MKKLIIFGTTDQAQLACFFFKHDSAYEPVAFTVDDEFITTETFQGLPVIPFNEVQQHFPPDKHEIFVALGYKTMNELRARKVSESKKKGYKLASYVSSKAILWEDFSCGENCLILELNNIQPFVKIGNNVTLWSGNHIGHHSVIGDNTFLTTHVVISGRVTVGRNCFFGVNATVRDKISIADVCLIAAGSLVINSTQPYGVYMGSPARKIDRNSRDITI
jgi:sugar O-acyltransferase (sialic acid O-acetyltransferase NeuD family)